MARAWSYRRLSARFGLFFALIDSPLPWEVEAELILRVPEVELVVLLLWVPRVPEGGLSLTLQTELGWNTGCAGLSSSEDRAQRSRNGSRVDRSHLRRSSGSWSRRVGDLIEVQRRLTSSELCDGSRQHNGGLHLDDR